MTIVEKEITVYDGEKPMKVKIKQLDWITQQNIADNCMVILAGGKRELKYGETRIQSLLKSITEAPFAIDATGIKAQNPNLIQQIFDEIDELNNVGKKKLEKSTEQSDSEKPKTEK